LLCAAPDLTQPPTIAGPAAYREFFPPATPLTAFASEFKVRAILHGFTKRGAASHASNPRYALQSGCCKGFQARLPVHGFGMQQGGGFEADVQRSHRRLLCLVLL